MVGCFSNGIRFLCTCEATTRGVDSLGGLPSLGPFCLRTDSRGESATGPEITGEGEEPVECEDANLANKGGGSGGDFWTVGGGSDC